MNKTVVALSIITVAFAASTAYLAYELHQRDAAEGVVAALPRESEPASGASLAVAEPDDAASIATKLTPAANNAVPAAGVAAPAESRGRDLQNDLPTNYARQFLARYDDALQRPVLLEEQRTVLRRQFEKLKERLKLSGPTFEQLVTLLAEEQLQAQEAWARCAVDPSCDPKTPRSPNVDHTSEYQAMLGTDGAEAFTQFRKSTAERDAVIQLRGRLTDSNFLPEAQAEKLIVALAEERERFSQEVTARGGKMTGWGTNLGMLWYTEDSGLPEQYIVEATQFSQRLRSRASTLLTPAQLAAYSQMQDELLAMFTANQRPPARQNKASVVQAS